MTEDKFKKKKNINLLLRELFLFRISCQGFPVRAKKKKKNVFQGQTFPNQQPATNSFFSFSGYKNVRAAIEPSKAMKRQRDGRAKGK
jgi:hypothetical protein